MNEEFDKWWNDNNVVEQQQTIEEEETQFLDWFLDSMPDSLGG